MKEKVKQAKHQAKAKADQPQKKAKAAQIDKENDGPALKEISGNLEERIRQINEIGKTHRPLGKIVGIAESANRQKEQMCTLVEMTEGDAGKKQRNKKPKKQDKGKSSESLTVYAVPVNRKLPWLEIKELPLEYEEDKKEGKKIGQRYYIAKFLSWSVHQKKP